MEHCFIKIHSLDSFWFGLRILFVIFLSAILSSCTTTNFHSKSSEYNETTPVTSIYLYSFLDLREGNLGPKFLGEVKRQFSESISQEGVHAAQLWFNESPLRSQFSLEAVAKDARNSSTRVPVEEVIKANQQIELSFGASHRLIAFPVFVSSSNTDEMFDIRWTLIDSHTNQVCWTTTSHSFHTKWFLGDENPQERAKTFVQGLAK